MATDNAQEAIVPVRGFLQTTYSKIRKSEMWWLPSPWDMRPMRGRLGGNNSDEFGVAAIEARDLNESSKWVEVLVEGKLVEGFSRQHQRRACEDGAIIAAVSTVQQPPRLAAAPLQHCAREPWQ